MRDENIMNDAALEKGGLKDKKMVGKKSNFKTKVCKFCAQGIEPNYKNYEMLKRYITERGKILPARITGNCAKHQRAVTNEIKKARVLAYLPFEKN